MARPDGKSVYVTLPADRKTPPFAFAEDDVFECFQIEKQISGLIYSDFIPFSKKRISDFIPFFSKTISDFIPFRLTNTKKQSIISVIKSDFGETLC